MKFLKNPRGSEAKRKLGADFVKLKIAPLLVAVILAVNPLALCASAAVWEGTANLGFTYWGSTNGVAYMKSKDVRLPLTGTNYNEDVNQRVTNGMRLSLGELEFTSPVSIYINGYYRNSHSGATISVVGDPWEPTNYEVKYTYNNSNTINKPISGMSEFTPIDESSMVYIGKGVGLYAKIDASEEHPVKDILVRPIKECGWKRTGANSYWGDWYWPNVRVITAQTSAELDALDSMANEITKQNETLEAMKGEIVALLQQIYIATGDIDITLTQTKTLVNSILGCVDGLEGQISDIYTVLGSILSTITNNHNLLMSMLSSKLDEVNVYLSQILEELQKDGGYSSDATDDVKEGNTVKDGLNELDKIDPDAAVGDLYTPNGETEEFASVLSSFFDNSLVMTMLMVSLSMSFVAYVLYGKR